MTYQPYNKRMLWTERLLIVGKRSLIERLSLRILFLLIVVPRETVEAVRDLRMLNP